MGGTKFGIFTASLAAVLLMGSGVGAQTPDEWAKVEAAGRQEGQLTAYLGIGTNNGRQVLEAFGAAYGIKVDILEIPPTELRERVRTETAAGRRLGDVIITGATISNLNGTGQVEKHGPLPNLSKLKPPFADDGYFIPVATGGFGILVNTDLVKAQDEPRSWRDLLDPKWKGKMLIDNPQVNGQGSYTLGVLLEKLGRDFIEKLLAQDFVVSSQTPVGLRRVGQGEFPLYVGLPFGNLVSLQGLPVKGILPEEGAPYTARVVGLVARPPHPNAAHLFMNYLLSDAVQTASIAQGSQSVTGRTSEDVPANMKGLMNVKLLGDLDIPTNDRAVALFREILGKKNP